MAERIWTVGSLPDCDIRVENAAVSGRHCRLTQRGESLLLEDLGSKNGTFVGNQPVKGTVLLKDGDEIRTGSVLVRFRMTSRKGPTATWQGPGEN